MLPALKCYADLAYSSHATIQNTYDLTCRVIEGGIEGDLVECGVAAGSQIGVMGHACRALNSDKRIYAYDSYEGIPLAGPNDTDQPGIGPVDPNRPLPSNTRELLVSSGITVHGLDVVQNNIRRRWGLKYENYTFVKGWFQDTVHLNTIEKIALLRLDGDLYESTKVCLDHLHHKVQKGGFVIVDDYALDGARFAVKEYFQKHNLNYDIKPVDESARDVHWYQVI